MCGRITQYRSAAAYARAMGWDDGLFSLPAQDHLPNWNVPPGSMPLLMHAFDEDRPGMATVSWGYRPSWAVEKQLPVAINARIEKASSPFFRSLWKHGRCVVPADGWYEWTGEKGRKQPWYIHLRSDAPMFLAAITSYRPDQPADDAGFVIVTAAADAGMVDVHDRRPVVFAPQDAAVWMDNSLPSDQAEQLARAVTLPADDFDWYPVSRDVNKVGNNDAHLIQPV